MKYENRKNGKIAEEVKRDSIKGTVLLQYEDGSTAMITTGTLKRWWKVVKEDEDAEEPIPEVIEEATPIEHEAAPELIPEPEKSVEEKPVQKKAKAKKEKKPAENVLGGLRDYTCDQVEALGGEVFKPATDINFRLFKTGGKGFAKFNFSGKTVTVAVKKVVVSDLGDLTPDKYVNHTYAAVYAFKQDTPETRETIDKILKCAKAYEDTKSKKEKEN